MIVIEDLVFDEDSVIFIFKDFNHGTFEIKIIFEGGLNHCLDFISEEEMEYTWGVIVSQMRIQPLVC